MLNVIVHFLVVSMLVIAAGVGYVPVIMWCSILEVMIGVVVWIIFLDVCHPIILVDPVTDKNFSLSQ